MRPNSHVSVPNSPNVGPNNIDIRPSNINVAPGSTNIAPNGPDVAPNGPNVAPNGPNNPIIQGIEDSDEEEEANAPPPVTLRTNTRQRSRSSVHRSPMYYPPSYLNVDIFNDSEDEEARMDVIARRQARAHKLILEQDMKSMLRVSDGDTFVSKH